VDPDEVSSSEVSGDSRQVQASATWAKAAIVLGCVLLIGTGLASVGSAIIPVSIAIGLLILASLCFAPVLVRASPAGVEMCFGPWRWPRVRVEAEEIVGVKALHVSPSTQGGWGYRGSLKRMGRAALVIRGGEGLQIDLTEGRRLVLALPGISSLAEIVRQLAQH
jgi:hypothetical protein